MKCIVCEQPNEFQMKEIERPGLKSGEALVRIRRIGICGTDIHAFKGNQPFFSYPRVLGHELSGTIEEIEENAFSLKAGDQVAVVPYLECGKCVACRNGKPNCCTQIRVIGVHADGGMREWMNIPYDHLIKTDGISLDQAAVIEPLSIGAHAVRRSEVQTGEYALVIGAGPIGLGVMAFAKQRGAKVIAMDINDERLQFCKDWANVDYTVNALNHPIGQLSEITNGDFPMVVFDVTGSVKSMENAFQYCAHGGKLIYVGLVKADITFHDPDFHKKELTLMGSRNATLEDFEVVLDAIKTGFANTDAFITHHVEFDRMMEVFENWTKPEAKVIKGMVTL
jgi:2-desacetyl-2-hydroxyethyl bacteriochlorophyllide A dehydrogenase